MALVKPASAPRERAESLPAELRASGLRSCKVSDEEVTMLLDKLCFLAPVARVTTALGARLRLLDWRRAGVHA